MYQIKVARKDKGENKIIHEVDNGPDRVYLDIRAGLAWPYQTHPGYWLILGQRDEQNSFGKFPLVLLHEGRARDLGRLFESITDAAVRLMCEDVYVDMDEENLCYRHSFSRYRDGHNIRRVFMASAPYVDNFDYGITLIREWIKEGSLKIDHGSIVGRQLGQIPESVLEESQRDEYFAIHALRFVLAAFVKSPWRTPLKPIDYGDPVNYAGYYNSKFSL
jgi:hypothetical protein